MLSTVRICALLNSGRLHDSSSSKLDAVYKTSDEEGSVEKTRNVRRFPTDWEHLVVSWTLSNYHDHVVRASSQAVKKPR
jgi:hypothetical protein